MRIKLSPVRSDDSMSVFRLKDQLTINGISLDFTQLPNGASLPATAIGSDDVLDPVQRVDGDLIITLRLPHSANAPENARFPVDIIDPADGAVALPGLEAIQSQPPVVGVIDWSQMITAEMKAQNAAAELLARVQADAARLRKVADDAIAPLQDAVDLGEATAAEVLLLKDWKRYRIALNRLPEQPGYPATIDWPAPPT